MINRNLIVLLLAQMCFVSGSAMTVTMGGIVGAQLAPSPSLSTLPVSVVILGTAFGTIPAAQLMKRIGRRLGFAVAAVVAIAGAMLAKWALANESFTVYCMSTAITGSALAFGQQFRFAAAESVNSERAAQAISFILLGSIGGAIVGPELVASGQRLDHANAMQGALTGSAVLFGTAMVLLLAGFRNVAPKAAAMARSNAGASDASALFKEPLFLLAVAAGVIGQGIMSFIMTATPVSMHVMDGHSLGQTASVIRAHVLAMYAPSLVSGWLISRFGERNLMLAGLLIYGATLSVGLAGHEVLHYGGAMVLLGLGWNLLFVGGTTLLVKTYHPDLRFRAQTINEFAVFGTSALGSLLAGTILAAIGWQAVLLSTLPAMAIMALALIRLRTRPLPKFC